MRRPGFDPDATLREQGEHAVRQLGHLEIRVCAVDLAGGPAVALLIMDRADQHEPSAAQAVVALHQFADLEAVHFWQMRCDDRGLRQLALDLEHGLDAVVHHDAAQAARRE